MPIRLILAALALALAATSARAQTDEEVAFVRAFMAELQILSIIEDREYCGHFARTSDGRLMATKPRPGKYNSCYMGTPPPQLDVFASYHTHAAFNRDSLNEIPSLQDLQSDIDTAMDGYISTPGGRLWFSDHKTERVHQLCSIGCLPQDPAFRPGKFMKIRRSYTLADLEWLMGD